MQQKNNENKVEMVIRVRVSPEIAEWLKNNKASRNLCNVTSKAISFYYDYIFYRKGFLVRLIDLHFNDLKYLLRKIGRFRNI